MTAIIMNILVWYTIIEIASYFVGMAFEWAKPGLKIIFTFCCFVGLFVLIPAIYDEYPIMAIALGFLPIAMYLFKKNTDDDTSGYFGYFLVIFAFNWLPVIPLAIIGGLFLGMRDQILIDFMGSWLLKINYVTVIVFDVASLLWLTKK